MTEETGNDLTRKSQSASQCEKKNKSNTTAKAKLGARTGDKHRNQKEKECTPGITAENIPYLFQKAHWALL